MLGTGASRTHRIRKEAAGAVIAGVLLLLAGWASAQPRRPPGEERFRNPYPRPSLSELVERSDTIVAGEVLDLRSAWTTDRSEIFTTVTLRPDRRFKGGGRSLVRFRIPGGTVGNTRLTVTHVPVFGVGERALVFLAGESGRLPRVVAGEAGKRHIRAGEDGEEAILPGFAVAGPGAGGRTPLRTLGDLDIAIRGLLAATRPR